MSIAISAEASILTDTPTRSNEDVEFWENTINELLPVQLFSQYIPVVSTMKVATRIGVLQLLDGEY